MFKYIFQMGEGKESEKNLLKMFFYDFLTEGQNRSIKTMVKRQCNVLQEFYSAKQRNLFLHICTELVTDTMTE